MDKNVIKNVNNLSNMDKKYMDDHQPTHVTSKIKYKYFFLALPCIPNIAEQAEGTWEPSVKTSFILK